MYNEICPPNATHHVVKSGDTFWRLSQTYGVSVQSMIDANPGVNANNLQIGSTLCVPSAQTPIAPPTTLTRPVTCPEGSFPHSVQAGDTLWRLSQTYGVSVQSILDLNPGVNPQNMQIGSTLCIPAAPTAPTPPAPPTTLTRPVTCPEGSFPHSVQAGDTLWSLSQTYGVSVQSILDLNPGVNPQNLQIGSTLCVPSAQPPLAPPTTLTRSVTCPEGSFPHSVQAGDTFWRLSQTYGVSVQSIIDANPGVNANNLQIGSTLCVPSAQTPIAPPTTLTPPVTCPEGSFPHSVQAGDTLWRLSQTYGISVQSILDLNPGVNPQNLQIGSTLCIPTAPTAPTPLAPPTTLIPPVTCPEGAFPHSVQTGDTLWRLSQTYGISVQSILDLNPGVNPQNLQIGSTLCIPTAPTAPTPLAPPTTLIPPVTCPEGSFPYSVQAGDTLWRLSQTYGVSVQSILDLNPGVNPQNLQIGSTLCIPTAPTAPTPLAPPTTLTPPASPSDFAYLIKRCDSICGIARKFYVSVESILQKNPGINPRCLRAGTYIYVPINCCEGSTCRYTVRSGDTLNRISNQFNVCPWDLIAANPNIDFQHLVRCQTICIPNA